MMMTHMITMSISVHLMMRITVMIVHLELIIHPMMDLITNQMAFVMMVIQMMTTMVVMTA